MELAIRRFEEPDERRAFPLGTFEVIAAGRMTLGRASYDPGWRWSVHVGAELGQVLEVRDRAAWRRWLSRHHGRDRGVWLVVHKKSSRSGGLTYEDAVLEALCFGWIDSTANRFDEDRFKQWFSPRKPRSVWSAINKERVAALIEAGAMGPSGIAAIERAKANGSWDSLGRSDALIMPDDLAEALVANPDAASHFEAFPPSTKKQVYYWIENAKRPETRARRVSETVAAAAQGRRVTEWRPREAR